MTTDWLDLASEAVGIEFGWRHVAGCGCRVCSGTYLRDEQPACREVEAA